jgi:hypothetical protein
MKGVSKVLLCLWFPAAFGTGRTQETRILSVDRDETLTWTNSVTNVYCRFESAELLPGTWESAPSPCWNILVTGPVMSVTVPLAEIQAKTLFLRLTSSTSPLPGGETYVVNSNGIPRFVESDYIELWKIERISRFRSGEGHDYSDDFESCRSMKHYFQPSNTVSWASIQVRSPVAGTVSRFNQEGLAGSGTRIRIKSRDFPAFYFILFHVQTNGAMLVGDSVTAGQLLGTHVGTQTISDIAVGVNTPKGWKLLSYFDVMTDSVFARYQARGIASRADVIISKEARDNDPLTCDGETFAGRGNLPNWVTLR